MPSVTTMREAAETQRRMLHVMGGDPYGVRTIHGAKAAYVRGEIDVVEFERRVDLFLRERDGQLIVAVLLPGERVIPTRC